MKRSVCTLLCCMILATGADTRSRSERELDNSRVEIPWSEFNELLKKISEPVVRAMPDTLYPAVDYLLTSAFIEGKVVDRTVVKLTVNISLQVLPSGNINVNGWIAVPLGVASVSKIGSVLERAELNGQTIPVNVRNGQMEVLISRQGNHQLRLDYFCLVVSEEGSNRFSLQLPGAAAAHMKFHIPSIPADVWVNGIQRDIQVNAEGTTFESVLSLEDELKVRYVQTGEEISGGEIEDMSSPKTFANSSMLMVIKENRIDYLYRIDYQMWHQKKKTFSILVPEALAVETVSGAGLADWKLEKTGMGTVLTAFTTFAPERNYSLSLEFSQPLAPTTASVSVPVLRILDVTRENGVFALSASKSTEVLAGDTVENLTITDTDELPSWIKSAHDVRMSFRYNRLPYSLKLSVRRHRDMGVLVAIADEGSFTGLLTRDGYWLVKYRYFIRNNHKQFLRVDMPEGWKLWSALIDGEPVMPASSMSASQMLIPLKKLSRTDEGAGFVMELVYWNESPRPKSGGKASFRMPLIDINCQRISGLLYLPHNYLLGSFSGSLKKGDGYSSTYLSNTNTTDQATHRSAFLRSRGQYTFQKKGGGGLSLPVAVEVPEIGQRVFFTKNMTIAGESADLSWRFRTERTGKYLFSFLLFCLHISIGFGVPKLISGIANKHSFAKGAGALTIVIIILHLLYNLFSMPVSNLFGAAFLGCILCYISYHGRKNRKEQAYE